VRCSAWLARLGGLLEQHNLRIAAAIGAGELTGPGLDERIVALEQSLVQRALHATPAPHGSFADVEGELDALLNPPWLSILHVCPPVRWYSSVLLTVRAQIRLPLRFAVQSHREKIGIALVNHVREDVAAHRLLRR
jgi:hypothetical protein